MHLHQLTIVFITAKKSWYRVYEMPLGHTLAETGELANGEEWKHQFGRSVCRLTSKLSDAFSQSLQYFSPDLWIRHLAPDPRRSVDLWRTDPLSRQRKERRCHGRTKCLSGCRRWWPCRSARSLHVRSVRRSDFSRFAPIRCDPRDRNRKRRRGSRSLRTKTCWFQRTWASSSQLLADYLKKARKRFFRSTLFAVRRKIKPAWTTAFWRRCHGTVMHSKIFAKACLWGSFRTSTDSFRTLPNLRQLVTKTIATQNYDLVMPETEKKFGVCPKNAYWTQVNQTKISGKTLQSRKIFETTIRG